MSRYSEKLFRLQYCSSHCGKKEVRRNLTFKEFCEITIPINLKERLS